MTRKKGKEIKNQIAIHRQLHGWTQKELALRINVTQQMISDWERGISRPTPYYRRKLAEVLETSIEKLELVYDDDLEDVIERSEIPAEQNRSSVPPNLLPEQLSATSLQSTSPYWSIPYARDAFFTGRETVLGDICYHFDNTAEALFLTAIVGVSGIGKTHLVTEYVHRFRERYRQVLWITAETRETVFADLARIMQELGLFQPPAHDLQTTTAMAAIRRWLHTNERWLLILDAVDDVQIIHDLLPQTGSGHILITALSLAILRPITQYAIELEPLLVDDATVFLLRRAGHLGMEQSLEQVEIEGLAAARNIVQAMEGLPLALDQAGAYINETKCGIHDYSNLYLTRRKELLARRGEGFTGHPLSVMVTFSLLFEKVVALNAGAIELLQTCAFLHTTNIPEKIITDGVDFFTPPLQDVANDPHLLNEAINILRRYALIHRSSETKSLSMHSLIQVVLKELLSDDIQRQRAESVVKTVAKALTGMAITSIQEQTQYFPHVFECGDLISQFDFRFEAAAHLLYQAADNLQTYGIYDAAEPMLLLAWNRYLKIFGENNDYTINCIAKFASLYEVRGQYTIAEVLYNLAQMRCEQKMGKKHKTMATILTYLANLYIKQRKWQLAAEYCTQALAILDAAREADALAIAACQHALGTIFALQGSYERAKECYLEAITQREQIVGEEHPLTLKSLAEVCVVYYLAGNLTVAEQGIQLVLANAHKVYITDHPDVARYLEILAFIRERQGDGEQAEKLLKRVLEIRIQVLGPKHGDIVRTYINLMHFCRSRKREKEADEYEQKARDMSHAMRLYRPTVVIDMMKRALQQKGIYIQDLEGVKLYLKDNAEENMQ